MNVILFWKLTQVEAKTLSFTNRFLMFIFKKENRVVGLFLRPYLKVEIQGAHY